MTVRYMGQDGQVSILIIIDSAPIKADAVEKGPLLLLERSHLREEKEKLDRKNNNEEHNYNKIS